MAHIDRLKEQGYWLFRWRSFLPLALAPFFVLSLVHFSYPQDSHFLDRLWELFCFAIALLGLGIRIYTVGYVPKGTSGRTTSEPKATELNSTGIYSLVRHPLYLANFIVWIGIVLLARSVLLTAFCSLAFYVYYERIIIAEEAFLSQKFGEAFAQWVEKTPAFIPSFKFWHKPAYSFSWRTVLTREYSGLLAIAASFLAIEILSDRFYLGKWEIDWMWVAIFGVTLLVFLTLRTLKKMRIITHP